MAKTFILRATFPLICGNGLAAQVLLLAALAISPGGNFSSGGDSWAFCGMSSDFRPPVANWLALSAFNVKFSSLGWAA